MVDKTEISNEYGKQSGPVWSFIDGKKLRKEHDEILKSRYLRGFQEEMRLYHKWKWFWPPKARKHLLEAMLFRCFYSRQTNRERSERGGEN